MRLKELLLELDTREQKYPGIAPKELVKDYKARMKQEKDSKSKANKKYRMAKKSDISHITNFKTYATIISKLPKEKNVMIHPDTVETTSTNIANGQKFYPLTTGIKAAIGKIPNILRGPDIGGIKYLSMNTVVWNDSMQALSAEILAYAEKNLSQSEQEKLGLVKSDDGMHLVLENSQNSQNAE